jgi:hypothetical protein
MRGSGAVTEEESWTGDPLAHLTKFAERAVSNTGRGGPKKGGLLSDAQAKWLASAITARDSDAPTGRCAQI